MTRRWFWMSGKSSAPKQIYLPEENGRGRSCDGAGSITIVNGPCPAGKSDLNSRSRAVIFFLFALEPIAAERVRELRPNLSGSKLLMLLLIWHFISDAS